MKDRMLIWIGLALLFAANLRAFALMGYDKRQAKKGTRRVPERRLFLAAACFGGLGGVLGMSAFRHKTKHWYFRVFFPLLLFLQAAAISAGAYLYLR